MPAGCARIVRAEWAALLILAGFAAAVAQPNPVSVPRTTVVVFSDRSMQPGEWTALASALRNDLSKGIKELQALDPMAEFVRGEDLPPGLEVQRSITVYLHGDCSLRPQERRTAFGVPLGWVFRVDGRIEPFAHVDCTSIAKVLGGKARWISSQRRENLMAGAMARVILHEWIHIATQNRRHAETGIAKAEFGVADLIENAQLPPIPGGGQ